MNRLLLTIPGEPVAKGRARHSVRGGHVRTYTPDKTRNYEAEIRAIAAEKWGARDPLTYTPVSVRVTAYRSIPASFSKKKRDVAACGALRPTTKPDTDNYCNSCLDGLNGVVFKDDSMVVDLTASKFYSERPRLEIVVEWDE